MVSSDEYFVGIILGLQPRDKFAVITGRAGDVTGDD